MAISRAQLAKELEPGLNALFGMEYDRYENETAEIFETESSDRAFEEEVLIIGFGNAEVKTEGQGVNYDTASEGFTARYTHETVALAFALTEEAVEDNLYDRLGSRYTKALARSMAHSKQVKGANVLNNAFSSSYTGGDGLSLVNSAHTLAGGGTFSNRPSTYVDLNETSLENALISVSTFVDDRSLILALQGTKLVVPPQQQFIAERILETPGLPFSADNDVNPIRSMGMVPQGYAVNHFLTDNDAWFLLSDCPDGLKHFERTPISTSMEGDFDTGNVRFKARERYSFGWSNPRAIYGSSGA
jgi:hypothetical protein|tara:strand:- start:435 stop:1343 length:909 start_codon:yes stop_codon:yes gene_type:complete